MVPFCSVQIFREEKNVLICLGAAIFMYFFSMDIILYTVLQETKLYESAAAKVSSYSPFHPLTMKLMMLDHSSQYFIKPTTEIFNKMTNFSTVFFFITPNMISMFHVIIALISGKFVASESLRDRRIGILLFEFRTWLDGLDGVVYRARAGENVYHSHRFSPGYYMDLICDTVGGFAICFGVLFYLYKYFDKKALEVPTWTKNGTNGSPNGHVVTPSKKYIFWRVFCYGLMIGIASKCWDTFVDHMEKLYEVPLQDPHLTTIQTETLHSWFTWCLITLWRLMQGQQLLQFLVVAIAIDKVWEFLSIVQYLGHVVIICLSIISYSYIQYVKYLLHL